MFLANSVSLDGVVSRLARERAVFHSEAHRFWAYKKCRFTPTQALFEAFVDRIEKH